MNWTYASKAQNAFIKFFCVSVMHPGIVGSARGAEPNRHEAAAIQSSSALASGS